MKIEQSQLTKLNSNTTSAENVKDSKLKKACNDFEAIIVKQLLTTMRKSVPKGGLFESGYENEMYQSMQDDELAKSIAHGKGMGIAKALYNEVSGKTSQTTNIGQPYDTIK